MNLPPPHDPDDPGKGPEPLPPLWEESHTSGPLDHDIEFGADGDALDPFGQATFAPAPSPSSDTDTSGPVFILRLGDPAFTMELPLLMQWIDDLLIPCYLREPTPTEPWCPTWWEHEEALARLHALWMAWQELTDPEAGGWTGPSSWHRDHLDPAIRELRAPDGPFARCMTDLERPIHRQAKTVAWTLPTPDTDLQPAT
jgi:hypothetical protein